MCFPWKTCFTNFITPQLGKILPNFPLKNDRVLTDFTHRDRHQLLFDNLDYACHRHGREMVWRKAWAANWDEVKYCSEGCKRTSLAPE